MQIKRFQRPVPPPFYPAIGAFGSRMHPFFDEDDKSGGKKEDKTFTQEEVNSMVAREKGRWKEQNPGTSKEDTDDLARLRQEETDRKTKKDKDAGDFDRILKSKDDAHTEELGKRDANTDRLTKALKRDRCRGKLVSVAAKMNAIDPEEVADLLSGRMRLSDDLETEVLDEGGEVMLVAGKMISVEKMMEKWAKSRTHLFKPTDVKSQGSTGGSKTSDGGGKEYTADDIGKAKKAADDAEKAATEAGAPPGLVAKAFHLRSVADKLAAAKEKAA